MRKIILTLGLILVLMTAVPAPGVGSIDTECRAYGFDYGIVKYEWTAAGAYVPEGLAKSPYVITVTGDDESADWTADPAVAGVLHKASTETFVHAGGTSGTVTAGDHDISHITFCGNEGTTVPETALAVGLIALLTPGMIYLIRRKRE
jgi:hypothetical protein